MAEMLAEGPEGPEMAVMLVEFVGGSSPKVRRRFAQAAP